MGLLDDFAVYVDGLKRSAKNTLADTMNDPGGLLSRRLSQVSESLPMPAGSVMPQGGGELLPRPSMQEWGTNVALNAPTMGLLGATIPKNKLTPIGKYAGNADLFSDNTGNGFVRRTSPSGKEFWSPGKLTTTGDVDYYGLNMPMFDSYESAAAAIRKLKAQDRALVASRKYEGVPNSWTGEARKIAKALIDNDVPVDNFFSSTQSKSKYVYLQDGRKIRISDHNLPAHYESADIEHSFGDDIKNLLKKISD